MGSTNVISQIQASGAVKSRFLDMHKVSKVMCKWIPEQPDLSPLNAAARFWSFAVHGNVFAHGGIVMLHHAVGAKGRQMCHTADDGRGIFAHSAIAHFEFF